MTAVESIKRAAVPQQEGVRVGANRRSQSVDDEYEDEDGDDYETETDIDDNETSEGEDDDDDDDDEEEEEEEEHWSLRVRLLSAVDLPPSLSPSVPLCPWFTLGLVEDVNAALDKVAALEMDQEQQLEQQQQQLVGNSTTNQSSNDDAEADNASSTPAQNILSFNEAAEEQHRSPLSTKLGNNNIQTRKNKNTTLRLLSSLTPHYTRTSTSKIMSRNANGGGGNGADWNEEYRWDNLTSPMESCLLVKLNTRLLGEEDGGGTSFTHDQHSHQHQHPQYDGNYSNMEVGGANNLIRGLWRKGREQLEQRRGVVPAGGPGGVGMVGGGTTVSSSATVSTSSSTTISTPGHYPREERAATVAQFLMQQHSPVPSHQPQQQQSPTQQLPHQQHCETESEDDQYKDDRNQHPNDETHPNSSSDLAQPNSPTIDTDITTAAMISSHRQEGLCLGTLAIPLSRLPLEDALMGAKRSDATDSATSSSAGVAAIIEKWYMLDDPNITKRLGGEGASSSSEVAGSNRSIGNLYNDDDEEEPTLLHGPRRCPSVLLEITFASSDYLDDAEDQVWMMDISSGIYSDDGGVSGKSTGGGATLITSYSSSPIPQKSRIDEKADKTLTDNDGTATTSTKKDEPELEPGIVDYVCIVGARDIGNQRNDDGSKGWVQSNPTCCVLERFPPTDEFHYNNGRKVGLVPQIEWFCFPEGCKLWRGVEAPNHADLVRGGVSVASSSPSSALGASNIGMQLHDPATDQKYERTKFDKALGTTTSFSWFVLSSNSDVYGSRLVKTYGIMIRFYVPAPSGIDPTQDDFGQTTETGSGKDMGISSRHGTTASRKKRLWVPMGICMTTMLPIVGVVEEILLRMCDALALKFSIRDDGSTSTAALTTNASTSNDSSASSSSLSSISSKIYTMLQSDLYHLIVNYSKPLDGVVQSSIPFIEGERLHITTCPISGLPPLPHGNAVAMTCRILGAEGVTLLLAAALTEHRVLIHSTNMAHVAMVAEVITALIFPFTWQLPYIPVLPKDMLEILEAPLPFFLGVPTVSLQHVDKTLLSEIVVLDLDDVASFADYDARRGSRAKVPPALPASVSIGISQAIARLLKEEDELEECTNKVIFPTLRRSPRLEMETLPERMFRIHVAIQICSLVRGYQECLFYVSASQPVFNRDRFLRQAPALFDDKRSAPLSDKNISDRSQRILSPRSKRFLTALVNSQHFHQLLERLNSEETKFFHEILEAIEKVEQSNTGSKNQAVTSFGSSAFEEAAASIFESLEKVEQNIPTYVIHRVGKIVRNPEIPWTWEDDSDEDFKIVPYAKSDEPFWIFPKEKSPLLPFTHNILQPILADRVNDTMSAASSSGVQALSLEYLVELEKNPWKYRSVLELPFDLDENMSSEFFRLLPRSKLSDAIGDRRFKEWKSAVESKDDTNGALMTPREDHTTKDRIDLSRILLNVPDLPLEGKPSGGFESNRDKDRDKVKRCLELVFDPGNDQIGDDLIAEAELALRNPSAQRYLFSVLTTSAKQRATTQQSISRLEMSAFECIVRLCYAILEACTEEQNYESAYRLLSFTSGFCTTTFTSSEQTIYLTERISAHPIYADLRLWERVVLLHHQGQITNDSKEDESEVKACASSSEDEGNDDNDDYDNVVTTLFEMVGYNVPAEEVSRFATRISEEKGWFASEKGQALLILARRLTSKRDEGDVEKSAPGEFSPFARKDSISIKDIGAGVISDEDVLESKEIAWSHPSKCLVVYERPIGTRAYLGNVLGGASETQIVGSSSSHGLHKSSKHDGILDGNAGEFSGRVAITAMSSFGGSAVVTGGVDGSIFLAHTINIGANMINGVQLQWGSKGEVDRDSCSGSITCIAASKGSRNRFVGAAEKKSDFDEPPDEDEILTSMDGCFVVAGNTGGSLRLWPLRDAYQASSKALNKDEWKGNSSPTNLNRSHHGSGATSTRLNVDDTQGALAGATVGGHRGGVTCIDLPPRMYRPDSLVSGGEDGLIKLWSLKSPSSDQIGKSQTSAVHGFFHGRQITPSVTDFDSSDAQVVLTGHEGKVLCIKSAWHGDKLLSGGADRTARLWDFAGSNTSPLVTLRGHQGWVTETHFWGSNTIISASTDRSIHLWDTRVGSFPLFALRYHRAPVSNLLLGNRSEPLMVSAGADGSLATWDFRVLTGTRAESSPGKSEETKTTQSKRAIRSPPMATMNHANQPSNSSNYCGSVRLAPAVARDDFSIFSVGDDGVVNEWEAASGYKIDSRDSLHSDAISGFTTFTNSDDLLRNTMPGPGSMSSVGGTITSSWDGTVRLRRLFRKPPR